MGLALAALVPHAFPPLLLRNCPPPSMAQTMHPLLPEPLQGFYPHHHPADSDSVLVSLCVISSKELLSFLLQMRFSDSLLSCPNTWVYPHSVAYPLKMPVFWLGSIPRI